MGIAQNSNTTAGIDQNFSTATNAGSLAEHEKAEATNQPKMQPETQHIPPGRPGQTINLTGMHENRRESVVEQMGEYLFRNTPSTQPPRPTPRVHSLSKRRDTPRCLRGLRDPLPTFFTRPRTTLWGFRTWCPFQCTYCPPTFNDANDNTAQDLPGGTIDHNMDTEAQSDASTDGDVKPQHISKQVETLMKAYYDKSEKLSGLDSDEFDSKLETYRGHIDLHHVEKSVWVKAFPFMLTDMALVFFKTEIEPSHDLNGLSLDSLVNMFRTKYNSPERELRLMDD